MADGTVAGMMDTVVETTATVRARAELRVLNEELRHRLKNTLAMVQALVRGAFRGTADQPVGNALIERIIAMGAAHDVLFQEGWTSATIGQVARSTLAATVERIDIDGAEVRLGARAAIALSLLLHELATNAAKYGALSTPDGRVSLTWTVEEAANLLTIRWREVGGPSTRRPRKTGFGTRLIDMGLSPFSTVLRRYSGAGFEAEIHTPMADLLPD